MKERDRLLRSLAKAEDAAFKNALAYLKERQRSEKIAAALPPPTVKRPRGRPRGSGLETMASAREVVLAYRGACVDAGRQLTLLEFAKAAHVSTYVVKDRLKRFGLPFPPI